MKRKKRVVFVGLDGVPIGLVNRFSAAGVTPHLAGLVRKGRLLPLRSSVPELSAVAWSSLITGRNPGEHGIYGFTDLVAGEHTLRFPNFTDLRCPPFWERIDGKAVILNVPSTYPVRAMNGVHVSGFVSVDRARAIYPPEIRPALDRLGYRIDVDSTVAHRSLPRFLQDLERTLEARIEAYRYLWSRLDWKLFMLVFTGTDRLMHFLWPASEDAAHPHHQAFLRHFRRIDEIVAEISARLDPEDLLVLASDHGFEALEAEVYVNYVLRSEGFLELDGRREGLAAVEPGSRAFALDPGRVYLNTAGRLRSASVGQGDRERVLADLESVFQAVRINGRKAFERILRREALYQGPCLDQAPDLVLTGSRGFNLKGLIDPGTLSGPSPFSGKHTPDDAFLLIGDFEGPDLPGRDLGVEDVRSLLEPALLPDRPPLQEGAGG